MIVLTILAVFAIELIFFPSYRAVSVEIVED